MEGLIVIAVVIALSYWAFKAGKREGSHKGFAAGRRRERRQRHKSRTAQRRRQPRHR